MFGYWVLGFGSGQLGFTHIYSSSANNSNLYNDLVAAGYSGQEKINVVVNSGVQLGSTSTSTPGMTVDSNLNGKIITFTNGGTVNGKGGAGGAGGSGAASGSIGGTGGKALLISGSPLSFSLTNNGEINGGGGGGGGGAGSVSDTGGKSCVGSCNNFSVTGGTGGNGYGNAANTSGSSGGSAGNPNPCTPSTVTAGTGGSGGGKGASGSGGGNDNNSCAGSGGPAGAAGAAIDGDSKITYVVSGTINGSQIN